MKSSSQQRNQKGTGLAELALGLMATIAIAYFALDAGCAMICYGVNDRACRDAARAAAEGSTAAEAQNLAQRIVQSYKVNGLLSSPSVVSVTYQDFGGNPPDGVSPFVTVVTSSTAQPIAPINLVGNSIASKAFPVRKSYTFPIVKLTVKTPA